MADREACQIPPPFYNSKGGENALEPSNLDNTIKSIFSTAYDSLLQLFDIYNNIKRQKSKKVVSKSNLKLNQGKQYITTSSFLKKTTIKIETGNSKSI